MPTRQASLLSIMMLGTVAFVLVAAALPGEIIAADAIQGRRPNVLLITTDQQRKDSLSVYESKGCPVKTPTVAALARDGIVFDRAYIASTTCTPSRASILTGQFPSRLGAYSIGTTLADRATSAALKSTRVERYRPTRTYRAKPFSRSP